jgi:uncharacterized protein
MYVAVCELTLHLPASASLKDKRQIVRSVLARLRNQFEISASEVDHQDTWQLTTLGLAYASGDAQHARDVIDNAVRYVEESRPDLDITGDWSDVLTVGGEHY